MAFPEASVLPELPAPRPFGEIGDVSAGGRAPDEGVDDRYGTPEFRTLLLSHFEAARNAAIAAQTPAQE